jgi:hypothetical protein
VGGASFAEPLVRHDRIAGSDMTDQSQAFGTLLERPPAKRDAKARPSSRREQILRALPSPRERTRADNRDRYRGSPTSRSALAFRCECGRPDCRVRLPLEVERHRRRPDRFIVGLAHADLDTVVGVADHFLLVEAKDTPSPRAWTAQQRMVQQ